MKVGIINVTGYAGAELARLVHRHPGVHLVGVTGRSAAGQELGEIFPHLDGLNLTIQSELEDSVDLVFSALPHKTSAEVTSVFLRNGTKVIDISADFRLKEISEYERWYVNPHPSPQYLREAVYGLPELHREEIRSTQLVANPGCYSTGAIIALAPAVKSGFITGDVVIDGKSGLSGAGRNPSLSTLFAEINENVSAYSVDGHRHLPEITQELSELSDIDLSITLLTHLIPMTRGILSSCYAPLRAGSFSSWEEARKGLFQIYKDFYAAEPFVRVTATPPQTKHTLGSNICLVYPTVDIRTGRLIVISCLDNLVKGAAGQAVQNMNVMMGFSETLGLQDLAVYP